MAGIANRAWVSLQLALGNKRLHELLTDAVQSDDAGTLAVLIERSDLSSHYGALLQLAVENGRVHAFTFLAGTIGEEGMGEALGSSTDLASLIVKSGSTAMVDALAELGFDLNAPNADGKTIACLALEAGKIPFLNHVIAAMRRQDAAPPSDGRKKPTGNSLDASFRDVPPLLALAIKEHRLAEVKLLLKHGASPNPVEEDLSGLGRIERMRRQKAGRTGFLQMAIEAQSAPIVEALADAGADLYPPGACLLEVAMRHADMAIVKLLARKMGQDAVNAAHDSAGNSMLNRAILDNNVPIAEFFMGWPGADLNRVNFKGVTPICEAANTKRLDIVELLIKHGVQISEPINPESRQTLLHNAVLTKDYAMARWLMARDIDVNAVDSHGKTALDLAVAAQDVKFIEMLVDSDRTDINAGAINTREGVTARPYRRPPLQLAIAQMLEAPTFKQMTKMADVVTLLVDLGADVNAQDSNGATALHQMARELERMKAQWGARGEYAPVARRILKALVKAGANQNITDAEGRRAVDIARQAQDELKMLYDSGDTVILPPRPVKPDMAPTSKPHGADGAHSPGHARPPSHTERHPRPRSGGTRIHPERD